MDINILYLFFVTVLTIFSGVLQNGVLSSTNINNRGSYFKQLRQNVEIRTHNRTNDALNATATHPLNKSKHKDTADEGMESNGHRNRKPVVLGTVTKNGLIKRQFIPRMYGGVPYMEQTFSDDQEDGGRRRDDESPCTNTPCRHDSQCVRKRRGYFCSCAPGFIGKHCEVRKECDADTCKNGGTCTEESQGRHLCTCAVGFRGDNCGDISKCHPSPCRNDGECSETEDTFSCLCKEGFRGKDCSEFDHCDPNPCKNSGTCSEQNGDFYCNCPAMYRGKTCEVVSECSTARCVNGGSCADAADGFKCKCPYGFFGKRCDVTPCQPNPCLNGGLCSMFGNQHSCQCAKGYSGKQCEVHSPCGTSICMNGGTCVDSTFTNSQYGFACVCPPNYDGILCEKHLTSSQKNQDDDDDKRHTVTRT